MRGHLGVFLPLTREEEKRSKVQGEANERVSTKAALGRLRQGTTGQCCSWFLAVYDSIVVIRNVRASSLEVFLLTSIHAVVDDEQVRLSIGDLF